MTEDETIRFIDEFREQQCDSCKKYKPNNKSFGCPLAHALIKKRTPMAIDNIKKFLYEDGRCKNFDMKGI